MDIHIDEFNRDVAIALLKLYNSFPRSMALYIDEIARVDEPDEYGVLSDRHQRCLGALLWLQDEGVIRFRETIGSDGIELAVLTLYSLHALNSRYSVDVFTSDHLSIPVSKAVPDTTEMTISLSTNSNSTTLIAQLRAALKEKSSEATRRVLHQFFNQIVKTRRHAL